MSGRARLATLVAAIALMSTPAAAQAPTIDDVLGTMQQLQRQLGVEIPGLGPIADCDTASRHAEVRLRDHGSSLELIRDSVGRLESAPASLPREEVARGAREVAEQSRAIAADIDAFIPEYERTMISCGAVPAATERLTLMAGSFRAEARRAEALADAQAGQPAPAPSADCDRALADLRRAETNAAQFVASTTDVVAALERREAGDARRRDAAGVLSDLQERRRTLDSLLTGTEPAQAACAPEVERLRGAVLGHVLAVQDLETRAGALATAEAAPEPAPPAEPQLTVAERRRIQQALAALELYTGPIDADFGRGTRAGIRAWQQSEGVQATGYLTRAQADRLIALQVTLAPDPEPTPEPAPEPAPEPEPTAEPEAPPPLPEVAPETVLTTLADEVIVWSLPPRLSPRAETTLGFAAFYGRMRAYADDGATEVVGFGAPTLVGLAYLEHGPQSPALVDALLLIAQTRQAEGDWTGAGELLAQARPIVEALSSGTDRRARRAAASALAWADLRAATSELAAALDEGAAPQGQAAERIRARLDTANRSIAVAGDAVDPGIGAELLVLRAGLAAALRTQVTDEALRDEIRRLFGG